MFRKAPYFSTYPKFTFGPKCRICLNFGHKFHMCPNKPISKTSERENSASIVKLPQPNLMIKPVKVHHLPLAALVDTGSEATSFNINAYKKFGSSALKKYSGMLTVFGNSKIKPLGYFEFRIMIDDEEFITNTFVHDSISLSVDNILSTDILTQG